MHFFSGIQINFNFLSKKKRSPDHNLHYSSPPLAGSGCHNLYAISIRNTNKKFGDSQMPVSDCFWFFLRLIVLLVVCSQTGAEESGSGNECGCFPLYDPLAIDFPSEEGARRKDWHGISCVVRHGPLPTEAPTVKGIRCERDAEGEPKPTSFTPWRCYPEPAIPSRFSFNHTLRCFMTKDRTPYNDDPAIHTQDDDHGALSEVCCSLRYTIKSNSRWNGVGIVSLVQIVHTVVMSGIIFMLQYVVRTWHPVTRLNKERCQSAAGDPFGKESYETTRVADLFSPSFECTPLAFICAYFLFNFLLFIGAVELLAYMPYASDSLLWAVMISLGAISIISTCILLVLIRRLNWKTYRWIKEITTKKEGIFPKPDFKFDSDFQPTLTRRANTSNSTRNAEEEEETQV